MSVDSMRVDICIATFRRPAQLAVLLESLLKQRLPEGVSLRIIVVDNDRLASGMSTVERFAGDCPWPAVYVVEPEANISRARNRGLSMADGTYAAFIDDDEEADPEWLAELLGAARRYAADVVFGPVIPVYPEGTPRWIIRGEFFDRPRFPSGTQRPHGGSGTVLLSLSAAPLSVSQFNEGFGRTGGEDTEFFWRTHQSGAHMVWCDSARVYEKVEPERMRVGWLVRRAFRGGQMYGRIFMGRTSLARKAPWALQRVAFLSVAMAALPIAWLGGRARGVRILQKAAANLGQLSSVSGRYYEGYGH